MPDDKSGIFTVGRVVIPVSVCSIWVCRVVQLLEGSCIPTFKNITIIPYNGKQVKKKNRIEQIQKFTDYFKKIF
jgi:hypothetical protein